MKKYDFAKEALRPWLHGAKDAVESRVVQAAVRDILSLQKMPEVSHEEMDVFDMLFRAMNRENRNWRSVAQVALPFGQMAGGARGRQDARLKSRLGLPVIEDETTVQPEPDLQMQVRRRFLNLVSMCIPVEERRRYPHILTLIDSHVLGFDRSPSSASSGVDAAAWALVNYFSTSMRWEHGRAVQGHRITPDMPIEVVKAHHDETLTRLEALINALPWRQKIRDTPASRDSLFAQLLINAALNRHSLETWAFENRLNDVLPMQVKVFSELGQAAPDGLDRALEAAHAAGEIDYACLVEYLLARTLAEKQKPMTEKVRQHIADQVEGVIDSARGEHFRDEAQLNEYLHHHSLRARALLWVMLTWCYQHEFKIATELPGVSRPEITVVSSRAKVLVASQHMSTLRRMLSTAAFSLQWEKPSAQRLALHARQNSAIRALVRCKLEESLKSASLAQWEAAANQFVPRDAYCTLIQQAEVGNLMRDYAVFDPVPFPLYV